MSKRPNYRFFIRIMYDADKRHEKYKAVVTPGHCYVQAGDEVVFLTDNTSITGEIYFPNIGELFGINPKNKTIPLDELSNLDLIVQQSLESGKEYPFAVYIIDVVNGISDFAEGCTAPRVIIE